MERKVLQSRNLNIQNADELIVFLEGPEEEMPLFGGASDGIRPNSTWGSLLGQLQGGHDFPEVFSDEGWPIPDLNLEPSSGPPPRTNSPGPEPMISSSGPVPTWDAVDIMQQQHDSAFSPAVHPAQNIASSSVLALGWHPVDIMQQQQNSAFFRTVHCAPAPAWHPVVIMEQQYDSTFSSTGHPVENIASSSGPAPAKHPVDIMQQQHDSFSPALNPVVNIPKPPLLQPSDWEAIKKGNIHVTNMVEKGKSVMVGERHNKGALRMMKTPPVTSLAEPLQKELRRVLSPISGQKWTTEAIQVKKQIAFREGKFDSSSLPLVGASSVTHDHKKDAVVVTKEEGAEDLQVVVNIVVQTPDFHDFDSERTEAMVKKNQVWALYDDTYSMPRFYCHIKKVAQDPFQVEGVWLEPIHPHTWLEERELSNGAGRFRLGEPLKSETSTIRMFSHVMESAKKRGRFYEVYPKQGEVWAIYTDYEKDTEKDTEEKPKLRYEYVVIRSDISTMTGEGRVAKLHKLKGYNTFWTPERESLQMTVRYNLHKFSHLVPTLPVTEKDVPGLPWDCLELDPASTPTE